jgi:DNA-binding CsgD family transcriptional regulator
MYTTDDLDPLIDSLYEASLDPAQWPRFLAGLAARLNGIMPTLFLHDTQSQRGTLAFNVGWDGSIVQAYKDYFSERNVWLRGGPHLLQVGKVRTSHMMCSRRELLHSEWYADVCQPCGFSQGIGATVFKDGSLTSNIAVFADSQQEFGAEQMALVSALLPHLQRALKTHLHLAEERLRAQNLMAALDGLVTGLILVGSGAKVLYMNEAAEEIIRTRAGLSVEGGTLKALRSNDTAALHALIGPAAQTSARRAQHAGGTLKIKRLTGLPLELMVSPIRTRPVSTLTEPAVAAIYATVPQEVRFESQVLACYGLTPTEIKVAQAIALGLSGSQAAASLGIRYNTLKTHLKRIFQKTHTRRQAELLRLMGTGTIPVRAPTDRR